jgi:mutator protein MutT
MEKRHTVRCAVYALFIKDHKILMLLREGTGWKDGLWGLPAGHLEADETIKEALVREVKEEVGINISEANTTLYHVMHRHEIDEKNFEYIDFIFKIEYWEGEPINAEPSKCNRIEWFDIDHLPTEIVPNVKAAIDFYKGKMFFSEFP